MVVSYLKEIKKICTRQGYKNIGLALQIEVDNVLVKNLDNLPIKMLWTANHKNPLDIINEMEWFYYNIDDYRWKMPKLRGVTVLFYHGHVNTISFYMALSAFLSGVQKIYYVSGPRIITIYPYQIILQRIKDKTSIHTQALKNRIAPRDSKSVDNVRYQRELYSFLKKILTDFERDNKIKPVSKQVFVINHSLAWGGAERQLVNMVTGMVHEHQKNITVICEDLTSDPHYEFYLWQLEQNKIKVIELDKEKDCFVPDSSGIDRVLDVFPEYIQNDIWSYYLLFKENTPSVVHAWQDSTSIKAGVAAVLAGVPNIVLCTRNIAPEKFAYIQPYMKPAYQALLECDNVKIVNNSQAGALDYERWLNINNYKFTVVYNGFDSSKFENVSRKEIEFYRDSLNIPKNSKVVGSVFRFYKEKDPVLWVKTAVKISKEIDDIFFLLIGVGPMFSKILAEAKKYGIDNKLILPGAEKNPALPISLMDVFLLTSKQEGTPNVIIEAQWLRVPVVATDAGGTKEAFLDGETGLLSKRRKPKDLAELVIKIINDNNWRAVAKDKSRAFVESRFGKKRMVSQMLSLYKDD